MATKKRVTVKGGRKKKGSKKSTTRKSGKKKSAAKSSAKKSSKTAAKKAATKKAAGTAKALAAVPCTLTAPATTLLVSSCAPQAADIGFTLSQAGIDTPNQRTAFRDCVFQKVLDAGCVINRSDIPNDGDTTLRDVVFAILGAI